MERIFWIDNTAALLKAAEWEKAGSDIKTHNKAQQLK